MQSKWVSDSGAVSTHSRLKAAGHAPPPRRAALGSFNTQPPEGGWKINTVRKVFADSFNTQPPEGGWKCLQPLQAQRGQFQHTAA